MGEMRNVCVISVGKCEGKRPLGSPRCRGEENIKIGLWVTAWADVYCIHLAQDSGQWWDIVNTVMNLRIP
jgi:hypothetical protein